MQYPNPILYIFSSDWQENNDILCLYTVRLALVILIYLNINQLKHCEYKITCIYTIWYCINQLCHNQSSTPHFQRIYHDPLNSDHFTQKIKPNGQYSFVIVLILYKNQIMVKTITTRFFIVHSLRIHAHYTVDVSTKLNIWNILGISIPLRWYTTRSTLWIPLFF